MELSEGIMHIPKRYPEFMPVVNQNLPMRGNQFGSNQNIPLGGNLFGGNQNIPMGGNQFGF